MPYGYEDSTGKMNTYDNTEDNYDGNMNQYADLMLTRIVQVVNDLMKTVPQLKSAIVDSVNDDGTVNVRFPSDRQNIYRNIQNQSIYQDLAPGDGVELMLKGGSFSNCWIVAKHAK